MWWTIVLTATGIAGLWLVARHWQGWVLYLLNEVLWFAYAVRIHAQPLMIMAVIWGLIGCRNLKVARELSRASNLQVVRKKVLPADDAGAAARRYLQRVLSEHVREGCGLVPHSHNGIGPCGTDPSLW